jgi:hypothetical protein
MSNFGLQDNAELQSFEQSYGDEPLADRKTDLYRGEFVKGFVDKWDELIDSDARATSLPDFFIHIAEKFVGTSGQLGRRRSRSPRRRHPHSAMSVPTAGDAPSAVRLDPTGPCTSDDSVVRNGR